MHQRNRIWITFLFVLMMGSPLFAIKFDSTWTPPDTKPVSYAGKKIVVLILGQSSQAVLSAERQLAQEISSRGAIGIAGHTLLSDAELSDKDLVKSLLEKNGVQGAVVIRPYAKGQKAAGPDADRGFWTFYGDSLSAQNALGKTPGNVDLYVETRVYSILQNKLLWTGSCGTKSSKLEKFLPELIPAIGDAMRKQGLLSQ
jgi:hypothetical protein